MEHNIRNTTPIQKKLMQHTMNVKQPCGSCSTPEVTQLLQLLIRATNAKTVVEVGCLTGCTTVALAMALPDTGRVITIDRNETCINEVRPLWREAGVEKKIEVRIGDAQQQLDCMITNETTGGSGKNTNTTKCCGNIDLVIIDCDLKNIVANFERALKLVRVGGLICIQQTLAGGRVCCEEVQDEETRAMRELNRLIKDDKRVEMCMLGISDGVTLCLRRE
jgi:O-methyltransferase